MSPSVTRRQFLRGATASAVLLSGCAGRSAQSRPARVPLVGLVTAASSPLYAAAFMAGLAEYGYLDGQNVQVEARSGEGQEARLPGLVAELIDQPVDVLVVVGPPVARAAVAATRAIPIVMVNVSDPVEQGWAASLARPGGNATGVANNSQWLAGKRLELLQEAVPGLARIAVPTVPGNTTSETGLRQLEAAGQALALHLHYLTVTGPDEFGAALAGAAEQGAEALYLLPYALLLANGRRLIDLALTRRLPTVGDRRGIAQAGALLSYGPDEAALSQRAAYYVDRLLRGAKPADLPIEQPTRYELIINLKTADALGIAIPRDLLLDATEVIQ